MRGSCSIIIVNRLMKGLITMAQTTEEKINRIISLAGRKILPNVKMTYADAEKQTNNLFNDEMNFDHVWRIIDEKYEPNVAKIARKTKDEFIAMYLLCDDDWTKKYYGEDFATLEQTADAIQQVYYLDHDNENLVNLVKQYLLSLDDITSDILEKKLPQKCDDVFNDLLNQDKDWYNVYVPNEYKKEKANEIAKSILRR